MIAMDGLSVITPGEGGTFTPACVQMELPELARPLPPAPQVCGALCEQLARENMRGIEPWIMERLHRDEEEWGGC